MRESTALHNSQVDAAIKNQGEMQAGASDTSRPRRMLNQEQVLRIVPVSAVTLWRMERKHLFPRGTFISPNKKIWFEDEVVRWQEEVDGRRRGRANHPRRPEVREAMEGTLSRMP